MRWNPTDMDGWWPLVSPSGWWIVSGNATAWLSDLSTDPPTVRELGLYIALGWRDGETCILCSRWWDNPDNPDGSTAKLWALHCPSGAWEQIGVIPASNQRAASGEHWAVGGPDGIIYDGQVVERLPLAGQPVMQAFRSFPALAGEWVVGATTGAAGWTLYLFRAGQFVREVPAETNFWAIFGDGWLGYELSGSPLVVSLDGIATNCRCRPDVAESCPILFFWVDGTCWVWTWAYGLADVDMAAFGRPLGESRGLLVPLAGNEISVACTGRQWVVAGHDERGGLHVASIDVDAERVELPGPAPTPPYVPPSTDIAPIGHPLWPGAYWDRSDQYGDTPTLPISLSMPGGASATTRSTLPVIVDPQYVSVATTPIVALYSEGHAGEEAAKVAAAKMAAPGRDVLFVYDEPPPASPFPVDGCIVGYELYSQGPSQPIADIVATVKVGMDAQPQSQRIALIPQAMDHLGYWHLDWPRLYLAACDLARDDPRVWLIAPFCCGRADTKIPEIQPWMTALAAAIPGTPPIMVPPGELPVDPPVVPPVVPPVTPPPPPVPTLLVVLLLLAAVMAALFFALCGR
jgi:hypothetical protein